MSRTNGEGERPAISTTSLRDHAGRELEASMAAGFAREGDALVLTIPPPPLPRRLLFPAALLAAATLLIGGPVLMAFALRSDSSGLPVVVLLGLASAGIWLIALRHLRQQLRLGRLPTFVQVEAGELTVTLPGAPAASGAERLHWPAGQVRDLRVAATGALPVVQEFLWLRVTPQSGTLAMIQIPWAMPRPGVGLLDEIQGTLREAVGLPRKP